MLLNSLANYAQVATALAACLALIVAIITLCVQRDLARRRAAVDFFFKTEMDNEMLSAWTAYNAAITKFKELSIPVDMFAIDYKEEYEAIRTYLNIHELIAAGIANNIFDDRICFDFWSNVFLRACTDASDIINFAKSEPGYEHTYHSLIELNRGWKNMKKNRGGLPPPEI